MRTSPPEVTDLEPSSLMEEAEARSRLSDWGDRAFVETLTLLVESCRETAALNATGREVFRKAMVRHLRNRLTLEAFFAAHPEKAVEEIEAPIVITGLPRTGTTLLHNLFALDPSHRVLRFWEALRPVPPGFAGGPPKEVLVSQAQAWLDRFYELSPAFRRIHPARPEGPEECDALLQNSFASQHFDDMFRAVRYSEWLNAAVLDREYAEYARQLRALSQAGDRGLVWVLKSPSHLGYLDSLLRTFPGALIVHCHRHPAEAMGSYASLVEAIRRPYSSDVSPESIGEHVLRRSTIAMDRALAVRAALPADRIVDVAYPRLVREPIECARQVYERFGRALAPAEEAAIATWLADNPQHKHGVHRYGLEQFGLSGGQVTAAFAGYLDEFALELA
ncbi:MAG: sulfotransferase [Actinomycetota bacterium]|nr:sulfotransferase [Actinomycetota bacterium]